MYKVWGSCGSLLLRFEVSVYDAQAVEVVQSQCQLCQIELYILLCKHHLRGGKGDDANASYVTELLQQRRLDSNESCSPLWKAW